MFFRSGLLAILGVAIGLISSGLVSFSSFQVFYSTQYIGETFTFFVAPVSFLKYSVLKSDLEEVLVRIIDSRNQRREMLNVKKYVQNYPVYGCINGSFYTSDSEPLGLIITTGKISNPIHYSRGSITNIVCVTQNGFENFKVGDKLPPNVLEAIQTSIVFQTPRELRLNWFVNSMSFICADTKKKFSLISFFSSFARSNLEKIFEKKTCEFSALLDGGDSVSLWYKGKEAVYGVRSNAYVPILLCLLPKKGPSATLFNSEP